MNRPRLALMLLLVVIVAAGCRGGATMPPSTAAPSASRSTPPPLPTPTLAVTDTPIPVASSTPVPTATAIAATAIAATAVDATAVAATETYQRPPPPITPTPPPDATPTPTPCAAPGRIETGALESAVAGEPMRYRVYLPPCYSDDGRAYPTLYMFGGNIHDDAIWDALGLDEAAETAIANGDIPPLLIVMPDNGWLANTTTSGPNSYEGFVLDELIPHIETAYCAWPEAGGRAVGGLSRGGYWSLMMAFRRPDLFRSAGAHSPALIDSYAGPAEDPAITGAANDLGDLRIWVDIGERDPYLIEARPLHNALTTAGVAHEWRVNPGTHEEAYWRENLRDYLAWYSDGWRVKRGQLPACDILR